MPRVVALLLSLLPFALVAQGAPCRAEAVPFNGAGAVWQRYARLTSGHPADTDPALRTTIACLTSRDTTRGVSIRWILPEFLTVVAGGVPDSRGDGALWAGRGVSFLLRGGLTADYGPVHLVAAPELWRAANRPYDILPARDPHRSDFASPFYDGSNSLDLPSRMGIDPLLELTLGQSALWYGAANVEVGLSASNLWWGPGVRDGLLFGPGAAGVPRLFVRTARPVRTPIGYFGAELFLGTLTESRWFDDSTANDRRALSAGALTWSPSRDGALMLGLARAVQRVVPRDSSITVRAFDFLRPVSDARGDRMLSMFGRLTLPRAGMRAFFELATSRPAGRLRDWLTIPGEEMAYQFGVEKVIRHPNAQWLLHAEAMNLDQGIQVREQAPHDFYTGYGTPHGWTQRGQLLGAGVGPGGQSQWLSADRLSGRWTIGLYGERVRWNNEALLRQYLATYYRHDVTLRTGIRGALQTAIAGRPYDVALDVSWGKRLNYLFQNTTYIDYRTVDVTVPQLRLTLSPRQ